MLFVQLLDSKTSAVQQQVLRAISTLLCRIKMAGFSDGKTEQAALGVIPRLLQVLESDSDAMQVMLKKAARWGSSTESSVG
jgi:hypothetical protein